MAQHNLSRRRMPQGYNFDTQLSPWAWRLRADPAHYRADLIIAEVPIATIRRRNPALARQYGCGFQHDADPPAISA